MCYNQAYFTKEYEMVIITTAPLNAVTASLNYRRRGSGYYMKPRKEDKHEKPKYNFKYPESKYWRDVLVNNDRVNIKTMNEDFLLSHGLRRENDNFSNGDEYYSYFSKGFRLYHENKLVYEYKCLKEDQTIGGERKTNTTEFVKEYYPDGKIKVSVTPQAYQEYDKNGNPYKGEFYSEYPDSIKIESLAIYENGKKSELTRFDREGNKTEFYRYDTQGNEVEYHHYDKKGMEDTEKYLKKQKMQEKTDAVFQKVKSFFNRGR